MSALARFLTKHHTAVFAIVIVLAAVSACFLPQVVVNKDMTKYIPATMQSKIGMDLMGGQFGDSSLFRLAFENVPADEEQGIADKLEQLDCVTSVAYEDTDDYHSGIYTLYKVTVEGGTYSTEANDAYTALQECVEDIGYPCHFDSAVIDAAMPNLGLIIFCAMIILIIILTAMSKSWWEPVLLLVTLGVAVLLNMGTNVVFGSVSDTTFSIAGVFQLVLSLDYSVMLMSRYRSERASVDDPHEAMEKAIRAAMGAISSSALTTIVGLACLVLMTFTIGRDMGLVLAKGVLFSLVCVFTVMPTLVIASDRILQKTAKRAFHPAMLTWAKVSHAARVPILVVFVILFASGFALRGLAQASFVLPSLNADHELVEEAFPSGSQTIVLYANEDEAAIAGVVDEIESMDGMVSVSSYASTLGKSYTAAELAEDMDIDAVFSQMLYYYHDNGTAVRSMTAHDFACLMRDDVSTNSAFADEVAGYDLSSMDSLVILTDAEMTTQQRCAADMAAFFALLGTSQTEGLTTSAIQQLYLLYYLKSPSAPEIYTGVSTLPDFVEFVLDDVATDPDFAGQFSESDLARLHQMATYTDVAAMTAQLDASSMAQAMSMDATMVGQVYYLAGAATMSVQEFVAYVVAMAQSSPEFAAQISAEQLAELQTLSSIIDASVMGVEYTAEGMANMLQMDATQMQTLFLYRAFLGGGADSWTMSAADLVAFMTGDEASEYLEGQLDETTSAQIAAMDTIVRSGIDATAYTPAEMSSLFHTLAQATGQTSMADDLDTDGVTLLYLYRDSRDLADPTKTMTTEQFVTFMVDEVIDSGLFSSFIDDEMRADIVDAYDEMQEGKDQLVGSAQSRLIIESSYSSESDEMASQVAALNEVLSQRLSQPYYLIGEGPMAVDMNSGFTDELNKITVITALAIFLIVLFTFRNLLIPIVLVGLIQGSYFWTMAINGLLDWPMYYVAIIIVQAILMGATIDYAILYTSQYREHRKTYPVAQAVAESYKGSIATMLTSGSILVLVTLVIGVAMKGSAVAQICLTIAQGTAVALIMVIFILPGVIAALDRWVGGRERV